MKRLGLICLSAMVLLAPKLCDAQLLGGIFGGILQSQAESQAERGLTNGGKHGPSSAGEIKIGDKATVGDYQVTVTKAQAVSTYTTQYAGTGGHVTVMPLSGQVLIVVELNVSNLGKTKHELVFSSMLTPTTAILNASNHGYRPVSVPGCNFEGYDAKLSDVNPGGAAIDPGESVAFDLVFSVPMGFVPRTVNYNVLDYADCASATTKATAVRIDVSKMSMPDPLLANVQTTTAKGVVATDSPSK